MAPILLHDMPELPQWNLYLLFVLWATQIFSTCLSELYVVISLFGVSFDGTSGYFLGLSLYITGLLNIVPFLTVMIPYEIYQYRSQRLTSSKYLHLQIIKTTWVTLTAIFMMYLYNGALRFVFLFAMPCIPYVGAAIYAWRIHKEFSSEGGVYGKL